MADIRHAGLRALILASALAAAFAGAAAQDAATAALRGIVSDAAGARLANARVALTETARGVERETRSDFMGIFLFALLPPGEYALRVESPGMATLVREGLRLEVGATLELKAALPVAPATETVTVAGDAGAVETQPSVISSVISEDEIDGLPLNGRRFADLALLTPGVTQDPRGLTSASNGDLAFGGLRGWQTSYLVDGADNNNAFFAQARGRYRAPYQFSNEVVQEFRVTSNAYGAELGRAGGGVVNVVTRSGSNALHGTAFYYLRDSLFNARHPYVDFKPADRQHQFGGTIGGPLRRNRAFFFAGFDQHVFNIPTVVKFLNGYTVLVPTIDDFDYADYSLVMMTAQALSRMGGEFRARLVGNSGLAKVDYAITPHHHLNARLNTSRYWGQNNVFFDPASPVTTFATSENGEERVATESGMVSLSSGLTSRLTSQFRAQFSRDLQQSQPNAQFPRTRISGVFDGFGRSVILPRSTREHRLHLTETLSLDGRRHAFKVGGDMLRTWIYNFFPSLFGGQYLFDDVSVDRWTFQPERYGVWITPLRAYAHMAPRYYTQNFGSAVTHPDSNDYAAFAQDTIRFSEHLAVNLGVRYDFQNFRDADLVSNFYYRQSGRVPVDTNNVAPRLGFALSLGRRRPLIVRGGAGLFYTRIPSIYTSTIESDNGDRRLHLLLDSSDPADSPYFPSYPAPLVGCAADATTCAPPAALRARMTTEVSAFAANFQTPFVQQASLAVEREVLARTAVNVSYLYVHGQHLIRVRDINVPQPVPVSYPVFDSTGENFLGAWYTVDSFTTIERQRTMACPFPPCLSELQRPYPQLGAINQFESAASSVYHGFTVSARRRMHRGFSFRVSYTWAKAMDDGQDALVAGRPATVQNSYAVSDERALSVTDQRHRVVASWTAQPPGFGRGRPLLRLLFNDWRFAGVTSFGTGRPVNARIVGDANRDGNDGNDRLPGYRRNAFTGPDYATTDLRLTRQFPIGFRCKLELLAESFNVMNRNNQRVDIGDDGFANTAGSFVTGDAVVAGQRYPAHFRMSNSRGLISPTNAYAPRQVQFALRLRF
jgi:hypothetical protein